MHGYASLSAAQDPKSNAKFGGPNKHGLPTDKVLDITNPSEQSNFVGAHGYDMITRGVNKDTG